MLSEKERIYLSIEEIELSDVYEYNEELFDEGIEILKGILNSDIGELTDEERETIELIYTIMGDGILFENYEERIDDYRTDAEELIKSIDDWIYKFGGFSRIKDIVDNGFSGSILCGAKAYDVFCWLRFGDVKFSDEYIRFDGYANLESFNYATLKDDVKTFIRENWFDVRDDVVAYFEE